MNALATPGVSQKCSLTHVQLSELTSGSHIAPACFTCAAEDAILQMTMFLLPAAQYAASTSGSRERPASHPNISISGTSASA